MAFLVFRFKEKELGRWALRASLVVGRSRECDISIRDIMLSRRHCRIEQRGRDWIVTDLASKNGTFVEDGSARRRIAQHILRDGFRLRIGKTIVTFCEGKLSNAEAVWESPKWRPADPFARLADTVTGLEFSRPIKLRHIDRALPSPKPSPPDPASYVKDDVRGFLDELVSSSWDSIYADASRTVRTERPPPRPRFSALPGQWDQAAVAAICRPEKPSNGVAGRQERMWEKRLRKTAFGMATIAQWMTVLWLSRLL